MSRNITVIVDDQDKDIKYLCPVNKQTVTGTYINNTWTSISGSECGSEGWFQYTFIGTRVQVAVSSSRQDRSFAVQIDNGPKTSYTGGGFYESPVLADGSHTITYYAPKGASALSTTLDYLTYTAGPSTPLNGHTLLVDDSDGAVEYRGSWSTKSPIPLSFDFSTSLYESTAHWSQAIGDAIEFNFIGNSIAVYGIVANLTSSPQKNITTTYTIDGDSTERGIPAGTLEGLPKAALFSAHGLSDGQHTLTVNVSQIASPQALGFDFFMYNSTAADLQVVSAGSTSDDNAPLTASQSRAGVIIGGVVGGLLLLGALVFAVSQWNKRRKEGADSWFVVGKLKTTHMKSSFGSKSNVEST
ncbi:hypothetical protein BDN72DRAFT_901402 [Pluteus cervinus]|uniref:Uncharacterized protein n=1 Tax=Pluteus cervinus TaxID=181527 RepID=A0ACD3AG39_9AGAR|nr:hypothetical protein BDN72DRAFT_901402 [Pluteus cervinus]